MGEVEEKPAAWQRLLNGRWVNCPDGWSERAHCRGQEYRALYPATAIATLRRERDEARAALAKERDECAKVADEAALERKRDALDWVGVDRPMTEADGWEFAADEARLIAAAIRARTGETR